MCFGSSRCPLLRESDVLSGGDRHLRARRLWGAGVRRDARIPRGHGIEETTRGIYRHGDCLLGYSQPQPSYAHANAYGQRDEFADHRGSYYPA